MQLRVRLLVRRLNKPMSSSDLEGESCPLSGMDYLSHQQIPAPSDGRILHVMIVSADRERKTTLDLWI